MEQLKGKVTRKEVYSVIMLSFVVMLITLVPYCYAYLSTPQNKVFIGTRYNNSSDFPTYLAWTQQAKEGNIFFKELYSSETQPRIFFNPLFLLEGWTGQITGLNNIVLFHAFCFIGGMGFLLVGYLFLAQFIQGRRKRLFTFMLFALGSGLGWLFGGPSVDIIQSEATNFLTLYESLVNTYATLLVLSVFTIFIYPNIKRVNKIFFVAILTNLLVLVHGYDFIIIACVLGAYTAYRLLKFKNKQTLAIYLYGMIFVFPAIFWQALVLDRNAVLGIWATIRTSVPAQEAIKYFATYGLLLLLAVVGYFVGNKEKKDSNDLEFLLVWCLVSIFLLFNPFSHRFQQKLSLGFFIPLVILCANGLWWWLEQLEVGKKARYFLIGSTIFLFSVTNIYVFISDFKIISKHSPPLYILKTESTAYEWLKNKMDTGTILSGYRMGNLIPAFSSHIVYIGHYDQTVNFAGKYELTKNMLSSEIHFRDPLPKFLKDNNIEYIVVDAEVRSWGGLDVTNRNYLTMAYENEDVQIYHFEQ